MKDGFMLSNLGEDAVNKPTVLKNRYFGDKKSATDLLFTPLKIMYWENIPSRYNKGKDLLMAQVAHIDKTTKEPVYSILTTESNLLVKALKEHSYTEEGHAYTKIVRTKDGKMMFTSLNKPELKKVEAIESPGGERQEKKEELTTPEEPFTEDKKERED